MVKLRALSVIKPVPASALADLKQTLVTAPNDASFCKVSEATGIQNIILAALGYAQMSC